MTIIDEIKLTILEGLGEAEVFVDGDGVHFEAIVISSRFKDLSLVKQHQMVKRLLKGHFDQELHALSLKTFTPEKWESEKHEYPR